MASRVSRNSTHSTTSRTGSLPDLERRRWIIIFEIKYIVIVKSNVLNKLVTSKKKRESVTDFRGPISTYSSMMHKHTHKPTEHFTSPKWKGIFLSNSNTWVLFLWQLNCEMFGRAWLTSSHTNSLCLALPLHSIHSTPRIVEQHSPKCSS